MKTPNSLALCGKGKNNKPLGFPNDANPGSMQMGLWNQRRTRKIYHSAQQVSGRDTKKGENCRSSSIERYMCRRNRSYKHPRYSQIMSGLDRKGVKK